MFYTIGIQLLVTFVLVAVASIFGVQNAQSAAAGAIVVLIPNLVFVLFMRVGRRLSFTRLMMGEAIKIMIVFTLCFYVWRRYGSMIQPLPYWISLIVVVKAHSFSLLRSTTK